MKDDMEIVREFGLAVTQAMQGVVPPTGNGICAVMIIVAGGPDRTPIGGSINYSKETRSWDFEVQLQAAERVNPEEEASQHG